MNRQKRKEKLNSAPYALKYQCSNNKLNARKPKAQIANPVHNPKCQPYTQPEFQRQSSRREVNNCQIYWNPNPVDRSLEVVQIRDVPIPKTSGSSNAEPNLPFSNHLIRFKIRPKLIKYADQIYLSGIHYITRLSQFVCVLADAFDDTRNDLFQQQQFQSSFSVHRHNSCSLVPLLTYIGSNSCNGGD